MPFEDILYDVKDGIARVTINRPKVLNAFRLKTMQEMVEAFDAVDADNTIGVAILTGAGDRAFCSGGEFEAMTALNSRNGHIWNNTITRLAMTIRGIGKPVIAMINGWCMGGGNEFNTFCDLAIASDRARFGQTGAKVGACPVVGATQYLPLFIGERKAKEMIFLCQQYTAQEALEMGLVNKVVPHEKLEAETMAWCRSILGFAPTSLRSTKVALNFMGDMMYPAWRHGTELLRYIWGSEESLEGMRGFTEKKTPNFSKFRKN